MAHVLVKCNSAPGLQICNKSSKFDVRTEPEFSIRKNMTSSIMGLRTTISLMCNRIKKTETNFTKIYRVLVLHVLLKVEIPFAKKTTQPFIPNVTELKLIQIVS